MVVQLVILVQLLQKIIYLFLPSAVEVFGTTYSDDSSQKAYTGEGSQYEFYSGAPIPEPTEGAGQFTPLKEHSSAGTFYTTGTSMANGWIDKYGSEITTYNYTRYNYNCIKGAVKDISGDKSPVSWWLRSPYCNDNNGFCCVESTGYLGSIFNTSLYVSFCFCI